MSEPCEKAEEISKIKICVDGLKLRWKLFGAVITIIVTLCCVGTTLLYRTSVRAEDGQTKVVEKIEGKTEKNAEKIQELEVVVRVMQSDMEHVKETVDKQDAKLDAILDAVDND